MAPLPLANASPSSDPAQQLQAALAARDSQAIKAAIIAGAMPTPELLQFAKDYTDLQTVPAIKAALDAQGLLTNPVPTGQEPGTTINGKVLAAAGKVAAVVAKTGKVMNGQTVTGSTIIPDSIPASINDNAKTQSAAAGGKSR